MIGVMMNKIFFNKLMKLVFTLLMLGSTPLYAAETVKETSAKITAECGVDIANKDDCIVRKFKDSNEAAIIRGKIAYSHYCILCHGVNGQGDGRAAKLHNPRPSNLAKSAYPSEYLSKMIRKGGEAMGRSPAMPPWGEQLTDEQTRDVVSHLMSIRRTAQ